MTLLPETDDYILIVDDEPRLTDSFKVLFENKDFTVRTAGNGYDALNLFKKAPAKVVISDIQMDKMDGIQLMHELKKVDPHVQIIFLTAYTSVQSAAEALKQNNAFDYIGKPVKNMDELFAITRRAQKKYDLEKNLFFKHQNVEKEFSIFKNILDSMEAITYAADMETYELVYANKKFISVFNDGHSIAKGTKCWQIIQKDQTGPCAFCNNKRLLKPDGSPGESYEWEFENTITKRWYNIVDKAIPWYDKRIVRLETAIDITEKKENEHLFRHFEKAIETSKKLESISTLAGGVAHDFNNSLSGVIGNINLAQLNCQDSETQKYLKNAENAVMQAKDVSSKLITFAKGVGPKRVKTDIEKLIQKILDKQLDTDRITSSLETDPIVEEFYADQNQLKEAFGNIIRNSVEAIEDTGHIRVRIQYDNTHINNAKIIVTIEDSGKGIPRDHLDLIFNPYFTTKPMDSQKSTGLGLSIAWSNITRHGGSIHAESTPDKGTRLQISLPIFSETRPEAPSTGTPTDKIRKNRPGEPLRILVMDDDELILDVISQLLDRLGYKTVRALNGNQAIQACRNLIEKQECIDVALLDYDIHNGLGGLPTMEELRKLNPDIRGILISGHADDPGLKGSRNAGFQGFMEKPFSVRQLNRKIQDLF